MEIMVQKQLADQIVLFNNERLLQSATAETKARKMELEEEKVARWLESLEQDSSLMELEFKSNTDALWAPVDAMMQRNVERKAKLEERRVDLMERRRVLGECLFSRVRVRVRRILGECIFSNSRPYHLTSQTSIKNYQKLPKSATP